MLGTLTQAVPEVESAWQTLDRLVDRALGGPFRTLWSRTWTGIPLDVYATEDTVVVFAALPGANPNDLELTVDDHTLTLSATIGGEAPGDEEAAWYLRELPRGTVRRSLTLPFDVDADKATATFEHGIVWIGLPKVEAAKPKKIAIAAGVATQH